MEQLRTPRGGQQTETHHPSTVIKAILMGQLPALEDGRAGGTRETEHGNDPLGPQIEALLSSVGTKGY